MSTQNSALQNDLDSYQENSFLQQWEEAVLAAKRKDFLKLCDDKSKSADYILMMFAMMYVAGGADPDKRDQNTPLPNGAPGNLPVDRNPLIGTGPSYLANLASELDMLGQGEAVTADIRNLITDMNKQLQMGKNPVDGSYGDPAKFLSDLNQICTAIKNNPVLDKILNGQGDVFQTAYNQLSSLMGNPPPSDYFQKLWENAGSVPSSQGDKGTPGTTGTSNQAANDLQTIQATLQNLQGILGTSNTVMQTQLGNVEGDMKTMESFLANYLKAFNTLTNAVIQALGRAGQ